MTHVTLSLTDSIFACGYALPNRSADNTFPYKPGQYFVKKSFASSKNVSTTTATVSQIKARVSLMTVSVCRSSFAASAR